MVIAPGVNECRAHRVICLSAPPGVMSSLTVTTMCTAASAVCVVIAIGMMFAADGARICAGGHGHPLASPRRRLAHYDHQDVQQQQRYSIEEQARDDIRDRRAVATDETPPGAPGPERVAHAERLTKWHLGAPVNVRAGSGQVAFGHYLAAAV